ncbi:MAG: DUF1302 family protein [Myxococcota bacterium]|nr:DUF1302 family protein [Myxococcota bacterium]
MARRLTALLLSGVTAVCLLASSASAFEFFDGRLEAHGYFESQLRFMSRDFQDSPDMTQWYNVFNLEIELDIAPDGFGPFDLLQAYVRAEVRFDCIYIDGCGMWPDQPYGNNPGQLPKRLSDGRQRLSRGQFLIPNTRTGSNGAYPAAIQFTQDELISPDRKVVGWNDMAATRGLSRVAGADGQTGIPTGIRFNGGDPNLSAETWPSGRCRTNYVNCTNFAGGATQLMGYGIFSDSTVTQSDSSFEWVTAAIPTPGDPATDNFAGLASIAGIEPTATGQVGAAPLGIDDPWPYLIGEEMAGFTFTQINVRGGGSAGLPMQILGPWEPKSVVHPNAMVASRSNPFDNYSDPTVSQCPSTFPDCGQTKYSGVTVGPSAPSAGEAFVSYRAPGGAGLYYVNPDYIQPRDGGNIVNTPEFEAGVFGASQVMNVDEYNLSSITPGSEPRWLYSPNGTPQASPVLQSAAYNAQLSNSKLGAYKTHTAVYLQQKGFDQVYSPADFNELTQNFAFAQGARQGQIKAQSIAGQGASPYKPIPLVNPGNDGSDAAVARGLWLPHTNLREAIESGKVNNYPFNCSESNRMWNRCDSQKQTKEVKEAYFDIEMLDSRLWLRVGKQNIVWGKTELFRTTDQFNPVDVSLATLGSLEESRIPLWAFRGVYSLYEVGPLEDVRIELAFNYDEFTPVDLGNCGEPYTVNIVCSITFGSALHSVLGIGVAGFNRPPDPWESIKGWEGGARIEFRWDKFSFAISDFYGFSDFPTPNRVVTYERNVDIRTGRPLVANAPPGSRCGLATGPENSFFPDPDCLRPGPSRRLELVNALLPDAEIAQNPGFGPED